MLMLKNPVFFNAELKISYQQLFTFLSFMNTFFETTEELIIACSVCLI